MLLMEIFKVLVLCFLVFNFIPCFNTLETLVPGQSIKDNETLISKDGTFEAGFFNLGDSNNQYFGVWYKDISPITVVWIANRDSPLGNSLGVFNVTDKGNLVIVDSKGAMIWSSNTSTTATNPTVQILDSGNLVVKNETNQDDFLWQSFDKPGDTLLPGMRIRSSLVNGDSKGLVSWRDTHDPSTGLYSYIIDTNGLPQVVITKGNSFYVRIGSWNGNMLTGIPSTTLYSNFNFTFFFTETEVSYGYELLESSIVSRYMLTSTGQMTRYIFSDQKKSFELFFLGPADSCDNYLICGVNSNCDPNNTPSCECLKGFIPKSKEKWNSQIWSDGCVRRVQLDCDNRDRFSKRMGMKLPDTSKSWFNKSTSLEECEKSCLGNCNCTAYASLDVRDGGSGCILWFNNILDAKKLRAGGQDLYIRVAASELDNNTGINKKLAGILVGCIMFVLIMIILGVSIYRNRRKKLEKKPVMNPVFSFKNQTDNNESEDIDIPIFDLSTIANATDNFSVDNKLGQGGFGPVYKGKLENGQDIAVKRLCNTSSQGPKEFINEVKLIANLQHRNLVKLLGCCIHLDERLLIYEFMINRSLDYFIFDQTRRSSLHWTLRFQIIRGIARGLLYLHEDSRLRIIHRDLKTSNILLDKNMNPKISDFGLARTLWGDEAEVETIRVVGTHGYISPEYAARGFFSVKSDVFSFGVIILETITGKKAEMAAIYCFYSLPDLLTNTLLQPLRVFLRSQKVTKPMMYCSLIAVLFHVPLNYFLVMVMQFGVPGVAMASVLTNMNMVVLMAGYVGLFRKKEMMLKWPGCGGGGGMMVVSEGLGELMKLAVPSCLMICLEWWWYEIVTVLAGYLENPTLAVAATGILIQTTSMMYTVPMALAACVSARVGNELGAGKPYKAKLAAMVALACAFVMGFINVTWTVILRYGWAGLFTNDEPVKALVASVMPIMGLCELGNCPQTTGCGILRGTARPVIGANINLGSFYFVGTPVAVGLAFWFKIGFSGLWFGLLSAQVACALSILYVVIIKTDWEAEALKAEKLTKVEMVMNKDKKKNEECKGLLENENGNKIDMC